MPGRVISHRTPSSGRTLEEDIAYLEARVHQLKESSSASSHNIETHQRHRPRSYQIDPSNSFAEPPPDQARNLYVLCFSFGLFDLMHLLEWIVLSNTFFPSPQPSGSFSTQIVSSARLYQLCHWGTLRVPHPP